MLTANEDLVAALAHRLIARARESQECRVARAELGRQAAARIAALLLELGAGRVILFGSMSGPGGTVHESSDLDLAVEGLPAERYQEAASRAEELAGMPVDLIRLEEAPPSLVRRIEEEGELVHVASR